MQPKRKLFLVVDADPAFVEDARLLLDGHRVLTARSLDEALEIVPGGRVDIAVLGPSFGSETGLTSAASLRSADPDLPMVLVANVVTNRMLLTGMRNGFTDIVDTPLTLRKVEEMAARARPRSTGSASAAPVPGPVRNAPEVGVVMEFEAVSGPAAYASFETGADSAAGPVEVVSATPPPTKTPPPPPTPDHLFAPDPDWDQAAATAPIVTPEPAPRETVKPEPKLEPEPEPVVELPPLQPTTPAIATPAPVPVVEPTSFDPDPEIDTPAHPSAEPIKAPPRAERAAAPVFEEDDQDTAEVEPIVMPTPDPVPQSAMPEIDPAPSIGGPVILPPPPTPPGLGIPPMPTAPPPLPGDPALSIDEPDAAPLRAGDRPPPDEGLAPSMFDPEPPIFDAPPRSVHGGRVVAVMAGKGGSGKTVTATNLAMALTIQNGPDRVVIVDADLQFGDVALLLQLDPSRTLVDVARQIDDVTDTKLDSLLLRHPSGLRAIAAPVLPTSSDEVPAKTIGRVLDRLRNQFQVVVVDTPPIFDDHLVTVLEQTDDVLMVVDMDLPSVKNAKIALDALRGAGFEMSRIRLVVNRANSKARLDIVELERSLGLRVAGSIPSDRLIPQSVNEGVPVVALSPRSRPARAFHSLAGLIKVPDRR